MSGRVLGAVLFLAMGAIAWGQQANVVKPMDFDLWCTEEMRLPYQRCAKRLTEDWDKFEAYRATIEKYEVQTQREKERIAHYNRFSLHNDAVDHAAAPDDAAPVAPGQTP